MGASGVVCPDGERQTDSAIFSCFYPIAVRTFPSMIADFCPDIFAHLQD